MSQSDLNVHDQIKQYVSEIARLKDQFDNTQDLNQKKAYLDMIRELHGKTKCLVLKHEIDHINDFQKDYKLISKNCCLLSYMELCIRKCEKKLRLSGQEASDNIFMPAKHSKEYTIRPKGDMYELSLNINPSDLGMPAKANYLHDQPTSAEHLNELAKLNSATSDEALSDLGSIGRKVGQRGGHAIFTPEDETLSGQVNAIRTTEGNNLVDEYLGKLNELMRPIKASIQNKVSTLTDDVNGLETSEANGLVEEYAAGLKGLKSKGYDVRKPTLLRVWANWCGPSRQSTPAWKEFERKSTIPGLQIVDLEVGDDPIKQDLAKKLGVTGYPTILLFKDGKIYKCGERSADGIELFCKQHLGK